MSLSGQQTATHLVPLMRYRDVGVASEWLCAAFGFEPHFAAKAPDGAVFYAELKLGDSMIMLGPSGEPSPDDVLSEAASIKADANEQSCYVVLDDVDTHYFQAKRSGANITLDIKSDDAGGRGYSCRDLEGHVWNFGTYDPWRGQTGPSKRKRRGKQAAPVPGLNAAIALTVAVSILSGWFVYGSMRGPGDGLTLERLREAILGPRQPADGLSTGGIARSEDDRAVANSEASAAASRAQRALTSLKEELEQERRAKAAALEAASQAQADNERAQAKAESAKAAALAAQANVQEAQAKAEQAHEHATELAKAESAQAEAARRETERAEAATAEAARVEKTAAKLREDLERQRAKADAKTPDAVAPRELHEAQAARDKAVQAAADAESKLDYERATKDSALKALADAGARIATLEVELKAAKAEAARAQARIKASATAATVRKSKKDESKNWPYSEW